MDLGSIFLILALAVAVGLFVVRPLTERRGTMNSRQEHEVSHLLAERERVLNTLQELDFDSALGKVPEGEYPVQRAELLKHGAEVLRQLDELQGSGAEKTAEARMEAAISARRAAMGVTAAALAGNGGSPTTLPDDQIEALLAQRRRSRAAAQPGAAGSGPRAAGFCSKCGTPIQKSDRFCPKCGTRVETD